MKLGSTFRTGMKQPLPSAARALRVLFIVALVSMALPIWQGQIPVAHAAGTATIDPSTCNQAGLTNAIAQVGPGGTVNFSADCSMTLTSSISISQSLTIDGSGHTVIIDGGNATRIFVVTTPASAPSLTTFSLNALTLAHGNVLGSTSPGDRGAAVYVPDSNGADGGGQQADLVVNDVTFDSNTATSYGAAIESDNGNVTANNSTFTNNTAGIHGGAINNNEVPGSSGTPIYSMTLNGDTFTGNMAGDGGAIALGTNSPATIINSSFTGNRATNAGTGDAIYTYVPVNLIQSTISDNTGPGAQLDFGLSSGRYTLKGDILNDAAGPNCGSGSFTDKGYNLANTSALSAACGLGTSSLVADPLLGPLQANGGPAQTMALGANSPAIGAMQDCTDLSGNPVTVDQRGVARPSPTCDIGAYQTAPSGNNLVINGSFEAPAIGTGLTGYYSNNQVPGWSLCAGPDIEIQNAVVGTAQDGKQYNELNSDGPSTICQTINTVPGQTYQLSFYFAGRPGFDAAANAMDAQWGTTDLTPGSLSVDASGDTSINWTRHTYSVTATSGATTIRFADVGATFNGPTQCTCGSLLDNVQVTQGGAPGPVFTPGENGAYTWGGTSANPLAITGTAQPLDAVTLYSGIGCSTFVGAAPADPNGNWSIPVTGLQSQGSYTYSANETNLTTGVSACSGPITINVDHTVPTSNLTFPSLTPNTPYLNAGGWNAGCGTPGVADVCGTASDGSSGVAAVFVAIENSNGLFWNGTDFTSTGAWVKATGTTSWRLAVPRPTDGVYTIASAAIDNAGNTEAIFGTSIYGICDVSGTGGQLSLNGGQLSLNGGLCTVNGTSGSTGVSGQLSLNGGQLSLNGGTGGQLSLNGGQLSLNGGQLSLNGGSCTVRDNTGTSGTLTITGGTLNSTGGQLSLNGGQLSLNGGLQVSGGQLSLNGGALSVDAGTGGQLSLNGGQLSLNGGDCTLTATGGNSGQLSLNGGQLSLNGGVGGQLSLNGGQLSLNGGQLSLNGGQLSLNGGQLSLNGGAGASAELGNVVVDTTAPRASVTVDGQTQDNSVNINPGSTVHVSFNETMAPGSITGTNIALSPSANAPTCGSDTLCQNVNIDGLSSATAYTLTIGGATDLAGNPATPLTFHFTTAASGPVTNVDSDGDGIPDAWDGGTVSLTGGRSINTATWGFTPTTKNLCVVENYMVGTAQNGTFYDQEITPAANQLIVNAFQQHGIHMVIFEGDAAHSAGLPGGYTGPYYGGQIGMTDPLGNVNNGAFDWRGGNSHNPVRGFEQIRAQNFVPTGLAQLCHYAVIAHSLGGTTSTGSSRGFDGSDFVTALAIGDGGIGNTWQQAGTVMHELGHNLGLHHGGAVSPSSTGRLPGDIDTNHKPNYLSVMNYNYQFTGVLQNTASANNQACTVGGTSMYCTLDYSESALPPLDQSNLHETTGIGASSNYVMKHECSDSTSDTGFSNSVVLNAAGPIDWNCDSKIASSAVTADIDGDSRGPTTLNGYDDWDNLNFLVGTIGLGATGTGAQGPEDDTSTIDVDPAESGGIDTIGNIPETAATVKPAAATIAWPTPADITYGTALSSTQLDASSSVTGSISYSPAIGTVLNPGPQTLTATFTPTDTADFTTTTQQVTFNVLYQQVGTTCDGSAGHQVLQPVNATGTMSVFKQGSTVPLKFRVCDANGNSVGPTSFAPSVVSTFGMTSSVSGTGSVNETTVSATADTAFRWDSSGQQWIYNLSTKSLTAGYTYTYTVTLNDGTKILITFGLR